MTPDAFRQWLNGAQEGQTDVCFEATPILLQADTGWARWKATFRRVPTGATVELDGVLEAFFDGQGRCSIFREWWHRRELVIVVDAGTVHANNAIPV
jgi:hypothetical protein